MLIVFPASFDSSLALKCPSKFHCKNIIGRGRLQGRFVVRIEDVVDSKIEVVKEDVLDVQIDVISDAGALGQAGEKNPNRLRCEADL